MDTSGRFSSSAVEGYAYRYEQSDRLNYVSKDDDVAGYEGAVFNGNQYGGSWTMPEEYSDNGGRVSSRWSSYGEGNGNYSHPAYGGEQELPRRERYRRDRDWQRGRERSRSRSRSRSRNRDRSPARGRGRERVAYASGYENMVNSGWSHGPDRGHEEHHESRRPNDTGRYDFPTVAPSATIVVKGLSLKTGEHDLYEAFASWGPLKHVRVIKERISGVSRGFAFVDFPSVEAAQTMMADVWDEGVVLDGRKLCFEYSKPTAGPGGLASRQAGREPNDWMCTLCGCANFARRVLCFQCNEKRAEDAPLAEIPINAGRKFSEPGPSQVLLIRGLDNCVDEESLHNEFSKHATVKDLRIVRDRHTQLSRGYAFVSFHSIEDATRAMNASNGCTLERNSQILRISFAKSLNGFSALANGIVTSAIALAQQYSWAPKEYNPPGSSGDQNSDAVLSAETGFVWDESSGYYYDASSGVYYDPTRELYYSGKDGAWYTYDQETQEYRPYVDENAKKSSPDPSTAAAPPESGVLYTSVEANEEEAAADPEEKKEPTLAESVAAAALAAQAAMKKAKERERDAAKSLGKKKISDVVNVWKQRQNETRAPTKASSESRPRSTFSGKQLQSSNEEYGHGSVSFSLSTVGRGGSNPFGGDYQPVRNTPTQQNSRTLSSRGEPPVKSIPATPHQRVENTVTGPSQTHYETRSSRPAAPPARSRRRFTEAPQARN